MSRLTNPPAHAAPTTTRYKQPVTAGAIRAWMATVGGVTVLVTATQWIPIAAGLIVAALSLMVRRCTVTRADAGSSHGLAGLVTGGLGLLLVVLIGPPVAATAAPGDYVLVSDKVTLERHDDGTATTSVSLINLTDQDAPVMVAAVEQSRSCKAEVNPTTLSARRQQSLKVTLTGCALPDKKGVALTLAAGARSFSVAATPSAGAQPDWTLLWWFLGAAVIAVVPAIWAFLVWKCGTRQVWKCLSQDTPSRKLKTALPGLDASWSFKDSWASTATVIAAAFTGVFGQSDVLKAIFGDDTTPVLALATVASAIALGLVGAAPLLLQAARTAESQVTVWGLLSAAVLTLAATGGELAVIALGARELDLGGFETFLPELGLIGGILLVFYAYRSLGQNLVTGSKKPKPTKVAEPTEVPQELQDAAAELRKAIPDKMAIDAAHAKLFPDAPTLAPSRPAALL